MAGDGDDAASLRVMVIDMAVGQIPGIALSLSQLESVMARPLLGQWLLLSQEDRP